MGSATGKAIAAVMSRAKALAVKRMVTVGRFDLGIPSEDDCKVVEDDAVGKRTGG